MSYWKKTLAKNYQSLDRFDNSSQGQVNSNEFYEFEPAIVLDVVLDENHKIFQNKELTKVDFDRLPSDVEGKKPLSTDVDYSWIGRALVRTVYTQNKVEKEQLVWAFPLESNISEYPLINEIVIVVKYLDQVFYTRKLNQYNHVHSNEGFGFEQLLGEFWTSQVSRQRSKIWATGEAPSRRCSRQSFSLMAWYWSRAQLALVSLPASLACLVCSIAPG
jgi:hypothetical protein